MHSNSSASSHPHDHAAQKPEQKPADKKTDAAASEFNALSREEKLYRIRHSFAHVMADAVRRLFPHVKIAIGPPIENGFYYDFDMPHALSDADFGRIEEAMAETLRAKHPLVKADITRAEAQKLFADEPYKLELIQDIPETENLSTYTVAGFTDLCRGPHVPDTSYLHPKACKLLSVAGAYWRGDEKRPMLRRIYATAWDTPKALQEHLHFLEEAEKRDHRKVGKALDLFSLHEDAGPGLVYWHPKGARIRMAIEEYWREAHKRGGYEFLYTPHVGKSRLWETSGHLGFYKETMYSPMELDASDYYIKPMNCPFHILIYETSLRSYKELPLRWAELGTVYRYERSGVLHGLLRVRGFTQDDAHIFCTPAQMEREIKEVLRFSLAVWKDFGFDSIQAYLATRPEKAVGEKHLWDDATAALKKAALDENIPVALDEGGGAFYGPKIDLKVKDALGREWQMSTIQFDFNMPERFNMHFIDKDGSKQRPYMIHRALLGSLERFFGVLIEHYNGAFPVWLAPVQAEVLAVTEEHVDAARAYVDALQKDGIRAALNTDDDRLGSRIRKLQLQKVPYMLVIGEKEAANKQASPRLRTGEQMDAMDAKSFSAFVREKISSKALI